VGCSRSRMVPPLGLNNICLCQGRRCSAHIASHIRYNIIFSRVLCEKSFRRRGRHLCPFLNRPKGNYTTPSVFVLKFPRSLIMNPVPPPPPDVSRRHYKILPQGTRQTPTGIAFFPSEGFFCLYFSPHSICIQKLNATLPIGRGGGASYWVRWGLRWRKEICHHQIQANRHRATTLGREIFSNPLSAHLGGSRASGPQT